MKDTDNEYSTIELDLSNEKFMELALAAHKQNITLNQYVENLLRSYTDTSPPVCKTCGTSMVLKEDGSWVCPDTHVREVL